MVTVFGYSKIQFKSSSTVVLSSSWALPHYLSQQQGKETVKDLIDPETRHLFREFDNPLVARVEEAVKKDLQGRNITSHPEREHLLIRHYAVTVLALSAERIYNFIWGSQIALLQDMNSRGAGFSEADIRVFYDRGKSVYPQFYLNYSFEQWLRFIESFSLISRHGEMFHINLEGREFLKYLLDRQYTLQKIG